MASHNHLGDLEKCTKSYCNHNKVKDAFEVKHDKTLYGNVASNAVSHSWDVKKWFLVLSTVSFLIIVSLWNIHLHFKVAKLQAEQDELRILVKDYLLKNKRANEVNISPGSSKLGNKLDVEESDKSTFKLDGESFKTDNLHSEKVISSHGFQKRDTKQEELRNGREDKVVIRRRRGGSRSGRRNNMNNRGKKRDRSKRTKNKDKTEASSQVVNINLESQSTTRFSGVKFINWKPEANSVPNIFTYHDGQVTVNRKGIFTVYGQITYFTTFPTVSFSIKRISNINVNSTIAKCLNHVEVSSASGESPSTNNKRFKQCYTSKTLTLESGDKIYTTDDYGVNDHEERRQVKFQPELTFWGIHGVITQS